MQTIGVMYPAMPNVAGTKDRTKQPAAIPMSPAMVMRCAPKRSTMRHAGTPVSAATSGPTDNWNRFTDTRQGEGQHDACSEALRRTGGNEKPERGGDAAQYRGH